MRIKPPELLMEHVDVFYTSKKKSFCRIIFVHALACIITRDIILFEVDINVMCLELEKKNHENQLFLRMLNVHSGLSECVKRFFY